MPAKKCSGSTGLIDPDDAPELTAAMLAEAEVFEGDRFVRRGPGRPKAEVTKEKISVRLDPDVLARLREAGPGWQSRINVVLRKALGLGGVAAGTLPARTAGAGLAEQTVRARAPALADQQESAVPVLAPSGRWDESALALVAR